MLLRCKHFVLFEGSLMPFVAIKLHGLFEQLLLLL